MLTPIAQYRRRRYHINWVHAIYRVSGWCLIMRILLTSRTSSSRCSVIFPRAKQCCFASLEVSELPKSLGEPGQVFFTHLPLSGNANLLLRCSEAGVFSTIAVLDLRAMTQRKAQGVKRRLGQDPAAATPGSRHR
jgi:hypothetical protein